MSNDEAAKNLREKFDGIVAKVPRFEELSEKQRHAIENYFLDNKPVTHSSAVGSYQN